MLPSEYWFVLVNAQKRSVRSLSLMCLSDDDAVGIAQMIRNGARAEVWRSGQLIAEVTATGEAARVA